MIDGPGTLPSFEERLRVADVLVYVHRPKAVHYWWVTKRLLKSPFTKPVDWPKDSPMLSSTLSSYRFLRLSDRFWTEAFRERILRLRPAKRVYVVSRRSDAAAMLRELAACTAPADRE